MTTLVHKTNIAPAPRSNTYPKIQEANLGVYWSLTEAMHVRLSHPTEPVGSIYYGELRIGSNISYLKDYTGVISLQNEVK